MVTCIYQNSFRAGWHSSTTTRATLAPGGPSSVPHTPRPSLGGCRSEKGGGKASANSRSWTRDGLHSRDVLRAARGRSSFFATVDHWEAPHSSGPTISIRSYIKRLKFKVKWTRVGNELTLV